jgi:hypothetical protein
MCSTRCPSPSEEASTGTNTSVPCFLGTGVLETSKLLVRMMPDTYPCDEKRFPVPAPGASTLAQQASMVQLLARLREVFLPSHLLFWKCCSFNSYPLFHYCSRVRRLCLYRNSSIAFSTQGSPQLRQLSERKAVLQLELEELSLSLHEHQLKTKLNQCVDEIGNILGPPLACFGL